TINHLLRTPAMKKHVVSVARKLKLLGFDVRTAEQKREDERQEEAFRQWTLRELVSKYDREKIYEEIWSEPIQRVAKRYEISNVGIGKICRKLNTPGPGCGYWAKGAEGKPVAEQPPLPKLSN